MLRRKVRADAGQQLAMSDAVRQAVLAQYAAHKSWSVQLHHDNLVALAETQARSQAGAVLRDAAPLHAAPTASTSGGASRRARPHGAERAEARSPIARSAATRPSTSTACGIGIVITAPRRCSRRAASGETPILFGVLDDRSRLACHLQWYLAETAEIIAHGLSQAFQKRGLPRAALSDNGAAMTAAEITEGLARLGILHQTTLPYSPYQYVAQPNMWRRR